MSNSLPKPLAEALSYLDSIGYHEVYLPRSAKQEAPKAAQPATHAQRAAPARREVIPQAEEEPPPPAPISGRPAEERLADLEALAQEAAGCTACRLSEKRQKVVFGSGNPDADLMLIGEGPGAEEDRQGLPFVGPAGELLTKILKAIDFDRDEVYIANVVKCRPPANRDPEKDEAAACRGFLERQIELVEPRVIVALGRVAAQNLLASSLALGKLRGRWHSVRGVPTRATYHPAALLRYSHFKRPTWEDMQVVRDYLRPG